VRSIEIYIVRKKNNEKEIHPEKSLSVLEQFIVESCVPPKISPVGR
jgi:hypothetical protein